MQARLLQMARRSNKLRHATCGDALTERLRQVCASEVAAAAPADSRRTAETRPRCSDSTPAAARPTPTCTRWVSRISPCRYEGRDTCPFLPRWSANQHKKGYITCYFLQTPALTDSKFAKLEN